MSRPHEEDRALAAVRRVRSAREQDSRIGLQHALAASRARTAEAERAHGALLDVPAFTAGSVRDFHAHVVHATGLAAAEQVAADRAAGSRAVAAEASLRWQRDRAGLRVVDLLLERRADERSRERDRREARELDDLAAQGWLRSATAAPPAEQGADL